MADNYKNSKVLTDKIITERGVRLELLDLTDKDGKNVYAYILVKESMHDALVSAVNGKKPFNPEDYGVIYAAGFGKTPPEELKREMELLFKDKLNNK